MAGCIRQKLQNNLDQVVSHCESWVSCILHTLAFATINSVWPHIADTGLNTVRIHVGILDCKVTVGNSGCSAPIPLPQCADNLLHAEPGQAGMELLMPWVCLIYDLWQFAAPVFATNDSARRQYSDRWSKCLNTNTSVYSVSFEATVTHYAGLTSLRCNKHITSDHESSVAVSYVPRIIRIQSNPTQLLTAVWKLVSRNKETLWSSSTWKN